MEDLEDLMYAYGFKFYNDVWIKNTEYTTICVRKDTIDCFKEREKLIKFLEKEN